MKYTIKAGVLYKNESQLVLVRIKSALLGPQRKILSIAGELLLTADARYLDESKASSGDVRNREYLLTDNENQLVGSAICGFVPEIICGIFIFCRYIEQENEFLVV